MDQGERHLRILVADERRKYLAAVSQAVEKLGHEVIAHETKTAAVAKATTEQGPDIAIVALHKDTKHALNLIGEIVDEAACPVVALAEDASGDFAAEAARRGVFAYIDSTHEAELRGGIDVALQRFHQYRDLLAAFDRRARIERAKGILMARESIAQQEAFERLRGEARNSRRKLIDVVDELLAAAGDGE